jgi:AraC-like DNA-binding protein
VRLDHAYVRVVSGEPHEFAANPASSTEEPVISIAVLGAGALMGDVDGTPVHLRTGDAMVRHSGHRMHYRAEVPIRMLSVMLDVDQVPPHLRPGDPLPAFPLRRTPLLNSYIAFVSALVSNPAEEREGDASHLGRALAELHLGVLAEARAAAPPVPGSDGLRGRISEIVDARLGDPDLDPGMIAAELGISLRYAHQVFNRDGTTIARFIRDRRLDAAAAALRDAQAGARPGELATRYGFGSRDQLARAFRRRYGMTMREYRDAGPNRPG